MLQTPHLLPSQSHQQAVVIPKVSCLRMKKKEKMIIYENHREATSLVIYIVMLPKPDDTFSFFNEVWRNETDMKGVTSVIK